MIHIGVPTVSHIINMIKEIDSLIYLLLPHR